MVAAGAGLCRGSLRGVGRFGGLGLGLVFGEEGVAVAELAHHFLLLLFLIAYLLESLEARLGLVPDMLLDEPGDLVQPQ